MNFLFKMFLENVHGIIHSLYHVAIFTYYQNLKKNIFYLIMLRKYRLQHTYTSEIMIKHYWHWCLHLANVLPLSE